MQPSIVMATYPKTGRLDWTHVRLFIEFKRGSGTSLDPFDDHDQVGNFELVAAKPYAAARSQIQVTQVTAYTHTTILYQHRNALYSLFVNGQEFRVLHWDRSGVSVTKQHSHVELEDPMPLLKFLVYFGRVAVRNGLDGKNGRLVSYFMLNFGTYMY
ncbi:hypothetical protein C8Q79DRAFT_22758 [Trametes meyenii]|nr:hypothetical protein C8Q79DRAFT_22758 [Trametes meyenii]